MDEIPVIAFLATGLVIGHLMARLRQSFSEVRGLNERLQLVVDTIPSLVARTRSDGSLEFMNQRWREFLGLPLDEAKEWAWTAALHPEDRRSPALTAGNLPAALRTAAEDCVRGTTLELEYAVGGPPRPVDPEIEAVVVRVTQEAITNVVKHADARTVRGETLIRDPPAPLVHHR